MEQDCELHVHEEAVDIDGEQNALGVLLTVGGQPVTGAVQNRTELLVRGSSELRWQLDGEVQQFFDVLDAIAGSFGLRTFPASLSPCT